MTHSAVAMAIVLPDGHFLAVNPAICSFFGRTEADLVSCTWQELTHPDDVAVDTGLLQEVLRGDRDSYRLEKRYLRPDGSVAVGDLSVAAIRGADGEVEHLVSQIVDITHARTTAERFLLLAEHTSDVVGLGTNTGELVWISPSVTKVMGLSPEEVVGTNFRGLVHPDDVPAVAAVQQRLLEGVVGRFEVRMRVVGGGYDWMDVQVTPLLDDQGRVVGRTGTWRPAVSRRERERFRAALDAELDCHVFLEAVRDGGAVVDLVYVEANQAAADYLGMSAEELIGSSMLARFPGQRTSGMFDRYVDVIESGSPLVLDSVPIVSEVVGEPRYFDFRGVRTGDGISLTWRDVTEAAIAAEALAASEERYQLLAENASDVVFRTSPDSVIEWVSPSVEELLGVPPEQMVGQATEALFAEEDRPALAEAAQQRGPSERINLRARYQRADGTLRWSETLVRPVLGSTGELVALIGSLRDVDDQVLAEKALAASERQALDLATRYARARDEALEANLAKTTFLSRMSHELRTPLNAVMGFAQLLAMDPLTDEQRDAVEHISLGGKHLLDLIREILDISRIESGRLALSMESVAVADAVSEALDLVRPQAREAAVELGHFDAAACDAYVWADRQRVIQILLNFLSNAVKYNREGGSCTVHHEILADGMVAIRVTDTGVGIASESLSRLFRPFDRLGAETTGVEGTGIGLTLSDGLAQLMSGRIEVATELGSGSTFSLVLPSAVPTTPLLPTSVPAPPPSMSGPRSILYIEDNPANRHLMERIVGLRPDATLITRERGAAGLEAAVSEPPDLVLLDLHLPDVAGDDVLRQLREDPRTADLPVVVVTADASADVRHRLEGLGATGFLTKPVDVDQVLRWIDDPVAGGEQ